MKRICMILIAITMFFTLVVGSFAIDPFAVPTASPDTGGAKECGIPMSMEEILEFSARDLELRMNIPEGALQGVTITALPNTLQGVLYLDGVEVEPYQFLSRAEIDELCFVPQEAAATASLTLMPQGHDANSMQVSISILNGANELPVVESTKHSTLKNTVLTGFLHAYDPDGDTIMLQVVKPPEKGSVDVNGQSFTYHPYHDLLGKDRFTVCAVDRFNNYSEETTIEIEIENNRSGFTYLDMAGHPSEYAAVKLHEHGILSGEQFGASWFFSPDKQLTRGDFLVLLLAATGLDHNLTPTVNTKLSNDAALPLWMKPYVRKAVDVGILDADSPFAHNEIPTRAEAVVLTDRAAGISDVKEYTLNISDFADIPSWAIPSYQDLAAYKMLDLYDGNAYPNAALARSYAADLAWQLWKHTQNTVTK